MKGRLPREGISRQQPRAARGEDATVVDRVGEADVIRASVTTRGYPPSIREIGDAVGLTSTSSVAHQLRTLERKGYLRRDPNKPRAVDVPPEKNLGNPNDPQNKEDAALDKKIKSICRGC